MKWGLLVVLGVVAACGTPEGSDADTRQDSSAPDAMCCEISESPSCGCFALGGSVASGCGGTLCDAPPLGWERVIGLHGCPMWVCDSSEPCGTGSCYPPWRPDTSPDVGVDTDSPPEEDVIAEVVADAGPDIQVEVVPDASSDTSPPEDVATEVDDAVSDDADTGALCTTTRDCALDYVCRDGHCETNVCMSTSDCPADHGCPVAGPDAAPQVCAASCSNDDACRTGESCKRFVEGRHCGRRGNGVSGSACADSAACRGELTCLPWIGGYCARAGCGDNADCEAGTWCVAEAGIEVCAQSCVSISCRESEGHECVLRPTIGGTDRFVCLP